MKQLPPNTRKSYKLTIIAFTLIVGSILLLIISNWIVLPAFAIGVPLMLAGVASLIGLFFGLKSLREANTTRKILSLVFNGFIFLCFIFFLLGDLMNAGTP